MSNQLKTKFIECLTNHGTILTNVKGFPEADKSRDYHYKFSH